MASVRIGVIGAGTMGERHCRVCANLPHVELVGVVDLDEARGRQVASLYGATYFSDHRALFPQVDAVTVAASTPVHYSLSAECLELGLHVMVEKPVLSLNSLDGHLSPKAETDARFPTVDPRTKLGHGRKATQWLSRHGL